jgi:hypothetical protein
MSRGLVKVYWFACEKCRDADEFVAASWRLAIADARKSGWKIGPTGEFCKECRTG